MSLYINDQEWVIIEVVQGELQAEFFRGFLESQGVPVKLNQEGAGRAFGLAVGHLGNVQILVPIEFEIKGKQLLSDYEAGLLDVQGEDEESDFFEDD
ncbi:MAG: DUF2007 domain-containing protein [Anaerolineales bacterium]|nr:DUF2007 domain-containing protein [Anaerolineales bacterium]